MKWRDQAILLVKKAGEDLYIMRAHVGDSNVPDELWGFHAQQAVEKLLKAILSTREIRFPFTHRLAQLADLLSDSGFDLPEQFEMLLDLTPFAVELRYSMLPSDQTAEPLDRAGLLGSVEALRQLASTAGGFTDEEIQ